MCGIAGVLAPRRVDPSRVEAMRDVLAHRGPDAEGLWSSGSGDVCLGHRRLAVIDPDPEADQPFVSHDGRFVLVYNGEIYNYRELRDTLESGGSVFGTASDTEVLVEAFRRWGADCLSRFSGMFAFALWDARERRLFCARDRVGEKPLYFARAGDAFLFASELKAIAGWPGFEARLSMPALVDFLTFGFVPDPKCIWEGCRKLEPGHYLWVDLPVEGRPKPSGPVEWWDLTLDPDPSVDDWGPRIRETLVRAADEMAVADVPLGTFLSGGVDSSAVTAALTRAGHDVATYTVGFEEEDFDERPWARRVVALYGTRHAERTVGLENVEPVMDRLLWHYDEPFNDYSYLPTYYLCRAARREITVALSGDGGDELFAGYTKYRRLGLRRKVEQVAGAPGRLLLRTAGRALDRSGGWGRTLRQYGEPVPNALADMLTLGLTSGRLSAAARGALRDELSHYRPVDTVAGLLERLPADDPGLVDAMRYLDLKLTLAGDILVKVDRASMAVSLEVRPVLLHRDMLDLAGAIPAGRLAGPSRSKDALKSAVEPWLPADLLHREKMGFAMPLGRWLADGSGGLTGGSGRDSPLAELVDPALLGRLRARHASGERDETPRIHLLQVLDRWLRKWT